MEHKRGQVTIFVIIGLVIVASVLIYFFVAGPQAGTRSSSGLGFEGCVSDSVREATTELTKTAGLGVGGFTYQYDGERIPYICYTNNFYETCTVQQPLLKQHFERSLTEVIEEDVQNCYDASVADLKSQGYEVRAGGVSYEVKLEPGVIRVPVEAPTTVDTRSFTQLRADVDAPIYDMLMIATTIIQQESRFGDADTDELRDLHSDYVVLKNKRDDGTTIYSVQSKLYGDVMQFASRSLAWPAGFDR